MGDGEGGQIANEFVLGSAPNDGISSVNFSPSSSNFLLVSSWDESVRLYDIGGNKQRIKYNHNAAVLDCCFTDGVHGYSGALDGSLKTFDFNTSTENDVGKHEGAIRCVEYCSQIGGVITGSWDKTIKTWDPRQPQPTGTYTQPDKAGRRVMVWDLRNMSYVQQKRESSLKYQTRCIRTFPNKQGYVLSSIEGRVAVEYFDPSPEVQKTKYAFKCHRIKEDGLELIYPVNTISFHNIHNTFATGGSDGYVNIWDGFNEKRLCHGSNWKTTENIKWDNLVPLHRYPTSISSLSFSHDGMVLAIASSFMFEEENKDPPEDSIYIRNLSDTETKPK